MLVKAASDMRIASIHQEKNSATPLSTFFCSGGSTGQFPPQDFSHLTYPFPPERRGDPTLSPVPEEVHPQPTAVHVHQFHHR